MLNLAKRAAVAQQFTGAGLSLSDLDSVLDSMFGGQTVWSGAVVSWQTAFGIPTFWACVSAIADDIATLPTLPYRRTFDNKGIPDGREIAFDHYLFPLLMYQVNPELSSWRFFQLMQLWLLAFGNAYAELNINGRGQIMEMWPWRPDRVKVTREYMGGPLQYQYRLMDGKLTTPVPQERMFHLRGLSFDGVVGMDPVDNQKQALGLNLGITEHGARYYRNGATIGGIIQTPAGVKLGDLAWERLSKTYNDIHTGLTNAHRTLILEDGYQWKEAGDNMVNAAYVATLGMTDQQIARFMKVPLHRVGLLPDAPSANVEEMSIQYVIYTLGPWCANWQNQIHCNLLSDRENATVYTAFDFINLLRGNTKDMSAFISALVDRGILSADECRERFLDMNKQPDGIGSDYWKAVNMSPVGDEGKTSLTAPANAPQVTKVQKKKPANQDDDDAPPKKNGHAASDVIRDLRLSDNLITAIAEFVRAQHAVN